MKKTYTGLTAHRVRFDSASIVTTSPGCSVMVQLTMENGICISPEWQKQYTYDGNQG